MPSASPFEDSYVLRGFGYGINRTSDTSVAGTNFLDCVGDFSIFPHDDLLTCDVTVSNGNNSSNSSISSIGNNNNNATGMTMAPHLGHLTNNSSNHQALPQQHQQQHLVVDVSPDASVVNGHHHNHLHHHHQHQQQQQQHHHHHHSNGEFEIMQLGSTGNNNTIISNNNNNNTNNMNNNTATSHKTIPVFSNTNYGNTWEKKLPADWDENDTVDFLYSLRNKLGIPCEYFASFNLPNPKGSVLLKMTKEDFQSSYPHHGQKFYDAFNEFVQQVQQQQQQHQHSPSSMDGNTNDLLGLQNPLAVHHHSANSDGWAIMSNLDAPYNLHPSVNNMVQPENSMGYCGDRHHYTMDPSYMYLNVASHPSHHHQHHSGSKSLDYGDTLQHAGYQHHHHQHQQHQQQHQQQQHESYGDYPVDIMGDFETYSSETPSDQEEIVAPSDTISINSHGGGRRPGRPTANRPSARRRKQDRGYGKLWEFIRDLLHDPKYCPSMVRWEDVNEGVFRIVQSERLANLWGTIKNNPRMTYEKLSRAMRYYYKSKVFMPVLGRRLVYKFGPHAIHWKPDNPNFEQPIMDG